MAHPLKASHATDLVMVLGGAAVFRRAALTPDDLRAAIHHGLPYRTLEALAASYGLPLERLRALLQIPPRTLARRKAGQRFTPAESDRLARVARICAAAGHTFGNTANAAQWLLRPNRALNGQAPLDVIATDLGTRDVETILGRIEHGVLG